MRVMIVGRYPASPKQIDGGVAAANLYLSQALVRQSNLSLVGVRLVDDGDKPVVQGDFDWPMVDLPLDRSSVTTLYKRQKRRFAQLLKDFSPEIVHGQGLDVAGLLAVRSGLPSLVTVHGVLHECAKFQSTLAARARARLSVFLTERPSIRYATDVVAISPYVSQYYSGRIYGRVHEIPNPVAQEFFQIRREPEPGRFLFAGRISRLKGIVELVQAVADVANKVETLVLAGSSPDKEYERQVRSLVRRCGVESQVHFAGLLDEPALREEFSRAEALVLPSYQETAPMVVQQAMAAGIAVIATRVGGLPYLIDHDVSGLLFAPGDVKALADLLGRFHDNSALGERLGKAARGVANTSFRAEHVARATRDVYERILSRAADSQGFTP